MKKIWENEGEVITMVQKVVCFIVVFLWTVFIFAFIKDRSRYRNCYLLFIAITFTIIGGLVVAGRYLFFK